MSIVVDPRAMGAAAAADALGAPVFWCPPGTDWPRWREAFALLHLCDPARAEPPTGAPLHWVSTECSDWPALVRRLAALPAPVVVLSARPASAQALQALEAGARGYCHVLATPAMLRDVALVVRHGGLWVGPELMARALVAARRHPAGAPLPLQRLSAREREVADLVAQGLSNREIAQRLDVTERTVKAHVSAAFDKLGVRDRVQLAVGMAAETRTLS